MTRRSDRRNGFEAWARRRGYEVFERTGTGYADPAMDKAYRAWRIRGR